MGRVVAVAAIAAWALALWAVPRALARAGQGAAWRSSPQALFARSRQAAMVAQEWATTTVVDPSTPA